jgi:hypothetical protein
MTNMHYMYYALYVLLTTSYMLFFMVLAVILLT